MEVRPSATDILRAFALATGIAELSEALNFVEPINMLDLDGLNNIDSSDDRSSNRLTSISWKLIKAMLKARLENVLTMITDIVLLSFLRMLEIAILMLMITQC